jgi:predicted DCC family thiol-disulfide oxidoreductase YuxK
MKKGGGKTSAAKPIGAFAVVLFDGECPMCDGAVRFLLEQDRAGRLRFASLQSDAGKKMLAACPPCFAAMDSVILIEGESCWAKSGAILRISKKLGGLWPAMSVFALVPRPIRDFLYDILARNRRRWFGRKVSCRPLSPAQKARFLTDDRA